MAPLDESARHTVFLAAVLFSILATAVALLWRRGRTAALAVGGLVIVTVVALHLWYSRRPSTSAEPAQSPAPAVRSYIE